MGRENEVEKSNSVHGLKPPGCTRKFVRRRVQREMSFGEEPAKLPAAGHVEYKNGQKGKLQRDARLMNEYVISKESCGNLL